jgi:hypothetical protein
MRYSGQVWPPPGQELQGGLRAHQVDLPLAHQEDQEGEAPLADPPRV